MISAKSQPDPTIDNKVTDVSSEIRAKSDGKQTSYDHFNALDLRLRHSKATIYLSYD